MGKQKLAGAEDQPTQEIQMERGGTHKRLVIFTCKRRPTAATVSKRTDGDLARKTAVSPTDFDYKLHFEPINILV